MADHRQASKCTQQTCGKLVEQDTQRIAKNIKENRENCKHGFGNRTRHNLSGAAGACHAELRRNLIKCKQMAHFARINCNHTPKISLAMVIGAIRVSRRLEERTLDRYERRRGDLGGASQPITRRRGVGRCGWCLPKSRLATHGRIGWYRSSNVRSEVDDAECAETHQAPLHIQSMRACTSIRVRQQERARI